MLCCRLPLLRPVCSPAKNCAWIPFNSQLVPQQSTLVGIYAKWENWSHWGGEKILPWEALVFPCRFLCHQQHAELQRLFLLLPCFISSPKGNPCSALHLKSQTRSAAHVWLTRTVPDPERRGRHPNSGASLRRLCLPQAPLGDEFWSPLCKNAADSLERVQRR